MFRRSSSYAAAVVETAGSGLVPLFREILKSQNGRHYTVDTFRRYEGGGLGAEIGGDVILMGSLGFMKLMRVRMSEGTRLRQAVYMAINGELAVVFALNYAPAPQVKADLLCISRLKGLLPVLATRDFMITPQFLKQRYKLLSRPDRIPDRGGARAALRAGSASEAEAGGTDGQKQLLLLRDGGFRRALDAQRDTVCRRYLHCGKRDRDGSPVLPDFYRLLAGGLGMESGRSTRFCGLLPPLLVTSLSGRV